MIKGTAHYLAKSVYVLRRLSFRKGGAGNEVYNVQLGAHMIII